MNTIIQFLIRSLFKIISLFNNTLSAKAAFYFFQKTYPKKLSDNEKEFYQNTSNFIIENEVEQTKVFEMGNPQNPSIILVHGWNSNAGSMAGIAEKLVEKNYHVILFDLPAHGSSSKKRTNIKECKIVFQSIFKRFKEDKPLSVVSHSFGSAVSAYALSELKEQINQLIFLTSPNKLEELFQELRKILALNQKTYEEVLLLAENFLAEPLDDISVLKKSKLIDYKQLTLIHDEFDKILPIEYSRLLVNHLDKAQLISFKKVGHYRMLWNKQVIESISDINFSSINSPQANELVA